MREEGGESEGKWDEKRGCGESERGGMRDD
jgi:hypothetical protein